MTISGKPPRGSQAEKAGEHVRGLALAYPGTREDFPWGHSAFKVGKKTFAFMGCDASGFSISVKLPESRHDALEMPFCEPTHYGLGKSGWVTASFGPHARPPLELIATWLGESYRAIAPKKLVAQLDGAPAKAASGRARKARK
jgi:predicted DNA-binding protein (MmcQ/YjbR family)